MAKTSGLPRFTNPLNTVGATKSLQATLSLASPH